MLEFHDDDDISPIQLIPAYQHNAHPPSSKIETSAHHIARRILDDALDTLMRYAPPTTLKGERLYRDTQRWILSAERQWLFSFENCCHILNLNPTWIRLGLRKKGTLVHEDRDSRRPNTRHRHSHH